MHEEESRVATLKATVEHYVPELAKAIADAAIDSSGDDSVLVLHQDSFADGYDDDEYMLLGMAVKYAGLRGLKLNVIGKNHEVF